jgi:hypothetical protein
MSDNNKPWIETKLSTEMLSAKANDKMKEWKKPEPQNSNVDTIKDLANRLKNNGN